MIKKRILVVDDEEDFAHFLNELLTTRGNYEVREECKGAKVLQTAREFHPDLILLDISMPDISGDVIASVIRDDTHLRRIPIIFVTALLRPDEVEGRTMSQSLVLPKPIKAENLLDCVRSKLEEASSQ